MKRHVEGYVEGCHVHDMIYDLIRSLSTKENFATALDGDERHKLPGRNARRLALQRIHENNCGQLANITVDKVRSLVAVGCNFGSLCQRIPVLRVLDLEECGDKDFLDPLVGSLHHLRYLRLVTELPREVRHLKFLQTLDLKGSHIKELPEEVGLLTQLVCLRTPSSHETRVPSGLISKLASLQELSMIPCVTDDAVKLQFVEELCMLRKLRMLRTFFFLC